MNRQPVILIAPDHGYDEKSHMPRILLQKSYARAVSAGGGLPIVPLDIYQLAACTDMADGLLLTGGQPPHPRLYGEEFDDDDARRTVNPVRDEFEMALIDSFVKAGKPVFGICRGCQMLNIYFGGHLVQNFPKKGFPNHHFGTSHPLMTREGSILKTLFGPEFTVNSYHKNAVSVLGEDMIITAISDDGIPEAIEHRTLPVFGTQFHPEKQMGENRNPALGPDMAPIFAYFVKLCEKQAQALEASAQQK